MSLPYAKRSLTSKQAAVFMTPYAGNARERVCLAIVDSGNYGLTDEEISIKLQMKLSTVHPRRGELQAQGLIQPVSVRKTTSGCNAQVWATTGFQYNAHAWRKKKRGPPLSHLRLVRDFRNGKSVMRCAADYGMSFKEAEEVIRAWVRTKR